MSSLSSINGLNGLSGLSGVNGLNGLNGLSGATTSLTGTGGTEFDSLISGLQIGPNLNNITSGSSVNSQAISTMTESAQAATSLLLNKIAPLQNAPESLYSSSAYGTLHGGLSVIDILSSVFNGVAGLLPINGKVSKYAQAAGPALGAIGGVIGSLQSLRVGLTAQPIQPQSDPSALEDYESTIDLDA